MANENKLDLKAIGQRIRTERERLSLSREEFAEIIGLSDYYVGQIERGERTMSLPALVNISTHLHESLDYLIFGAEKFTGTLKEDTSYYGEVITNRGEDITYLLSKCSKKELELITKLVRTLIPYLNSR